MIDAPFIKAYTIKEVSKKINVPTGTIRQWEKDLSGLLVVPRTKQGARFYTDFEIDQLVKIKQMRDKNLSKDMIKDLLQHHMKSNQAADEEYNPTNTSLSLPSESSGTSLADSQNEYEAFLKAMDQYKDILIDEVKAEIRNSIRKEVLEEVKKEISKGSLTTVKSLSDSIYKTGERTNEHIMELSEIVNRNSKENSNMTKTYKGANEKIIKLTSKVDQLSSGTNRDLSILAKRLDETTETVSEEFKILADYVSNSRETTNQELTNLNQVISQEREYFVHTLQNEREELTREIRRREEMFKDMVDNFRETAVSKQAKRNWWKIWK
ncbi:MULTISPECIES: MerR family transcriptional regulator [Mesobacillus]|uniref:HTH merR-type domain-containing protein n=2 Tax=Mesobacillus TaxID=2675231 RepID=A0A0D6Z8U9_9BACI|nr:MULTISPECIES: MerR family transcriptional regulator [Mesobacillus]KIY21008.1 hypothetical protein UB32_16075 [Mesobacillus subterraneus]MDQ0414285.1 DNA-binding transcriptional MerR regulator [Mesobacillus stamsii]